MKILLGTDGSECSTKAVYSIAHRPWPKGSKVRIVCVRELLGGENAAIASSPYSMYPETVVNEIVENARIRSEKAISEARAILSSDNADLCDAWHTPLGDPRSILLDDAKTWGADLIVVGSHGRHGLDRLLLGSVSESVALHAHCSVEVIRS